MICWMMYNCKQTTILVRDYVGLTDNGGGFSTTALRQSTNVFTTHLPLLTSCYFSIDVLESSSVVR